MSFARLVLSYGGCGLLPKIPGTWGTAGAALTAGAWVVADSYREAWLV